MQRAAADGKALRPFANAGHGQAAPAPSGQHAEIGAVEFHDIRLFQMFRRPTKTASALSNFGDEDAGLFQYVVRLRFCCRRISAAIVRQRNRHVLVLMGAAFSGKLSDLRPERTVIASSRTT